MKQNKNILKNPGVQSLLTSLLCILLGLFIGYLVLLLINPTGAWGAITNVMKNFLTYSSAKAQLKYLGNTLVRTAPLLMCSLSVLFVYKVGLFNIGAAGQYVAGACACLYAALYLHWHWLPCMLLAIAAGALLGMDAKNGWRIWRRDRRNHASPNSAQTESVCAGLLGVRLAGDAYYHGELHKKPYIGDALREVEYEDIPRAGRLLYATAALSLVLFGAVRFLLVM